MRNLIDIHADCENFSANSAVNAISDEAKAFLSEPTETLQDFVGNRNEMVYANFALLERELYGTQLPSATPTKSDAEIFFNAASNEIMQLPSLIPEGVIL